MVYHTVAHPNGLKCEHTFCTTQRLVYALASVEPLAMPEKTIDIEIYRGLREGGKEETGFLWWWLV